MECNICLGTNSLSLWTLHREGWGVASLLSTWKCAQGAVNCESLAVLTCELASMENFWTTTDYGGAILSCVNRWRVNNVVAPELAGKTNFWANSNYGEGAVNCEDRTGSKNCALRVICLTGWLSYDQSIVNGKVWTIYTQRAVGTYGFSFWTLHRKSWVKTSLEGGSTNERL